METSNESTENRAVWDNGHNAWPNTNIPKKAKTKEFYRAAIDFAINNHVYGSYSNENRITKNMNLYNSEVVESEEIAINTTGKKKNRAPFVNFNILKNKCDTLMGEFLQTPLKGTMKSINRSAITQKAYLEDIAAGMKVAAKTIKKLKDLKLVNPFEGMPIPGEEQEEQPKSVFGSLSGKSKNEFIANKLLEEQIRIKNIKDQFYTNMLHVILGSEAYGKVELDQTTGNVWYRAIDVRKKLALESDGDIYQENSPYMGEVRDMYLSEILREFPGIAEDDENMRKLRQEEGSSYDHRFYSRDQNNNLLYKVFTIEFKTYEPLYQKTRIDDYGNISYSMMSPNYYEKKSNKIKNEVKNGKYQVDKGRKEILDSVTRIGENVYIYHGEVSYIIGDIDDPHETEYNYTSLLFNTVNGKRVSIFEQGLHLNKMYNVARWLLNKELYKAKGMITGYNKLYLPRDKEGNPLPIAGVMWQLTNDGVYEYDTTGDENLHFNKDSVFMKAQDMGLSKMVPDLINLLYDIENALDKNLGMGPDRQGQTPASSTATNATNNLQNSRNATAPIFYFANRYFEKVLRKCVERSKVAIAFIRIKEESASTIVGNEAIGYIRANRDFANDSYAAFLIDGRSEMDLKMAIRPWMEKAINVGTLRVPDAVNFELQESLIEGVAVLERGMAKMDQIARESKDAETQSAIAQLREKMNLTKEDREDKQLHDASLEVLKGTVKAGLSGQEAMQQYALNNQIQNNEKQLLEQENQLVK